MECKTLTLSARNNSKSKHIQSSKIDQLLESIGLLRNIVPKDGNSLFRCISQYVFLTQSCHMSVRQHLLQFANLKTDEFKEMTQIPVSEYRKRITDSKMDGELLDMYIAAKFYKINISFYVDSNPFVPRIIETPNSLKMLQICLNHEGTYDLVFTKEYVANISFCQAIIYKMLYNDVFGLTNVEFAVREMLSGSNLPLRIYNRASLEKRATCTDMRELIELGITPFPFKVAKALSPSLYRNCEYDIWLNNKKEKFYGKWNNWEFKEGSKCMVSISNCEYHCYIQQIHGKNEPVEVYVKDLAKKMFVDFNQLKLMPVDEDMRDMVESPIQTEPSSINDGSEQSCEFQVTEQSMPPVQYSNNFIHGPAVHEVLPSGIPGQIFSPMYYSQTYQQQPVIPLNPNSGNMIHSWYVQSPPPLLSNDYCPFQEQVILFELPSHQNNNCVPSIHYPPPPTFINSSSKVNDISHYVQPVPPPWCCHQPPSMSSSCVEVRDVTINYNHAYQPCLAPQFDEPTSELQQ